MNRLFLVSSIILASVLILTINCNTTEPEFVSLYKAVRIQEGDNENYPQTGDKVTVHYTGTFPETGEKFDSSVDRDTPFTFVLKRGQVIQCWDEVVSKMSQGEKLQVVCPSRLAYGERGAGGVIKPNTDIAFEIELLSFAKTNSEL